MKVTVFDYGAGNLHSLAKAVEAAGALVRVERDPRAAVRDTDALVLPGVGAFGAACESLAPGRDAMRDAIARGLPTLGICLGMQLLLDESAEGPGRGLGVVPGKVRRLESRRIPQIGWNSIDDVEPDDPLFRAAPLATAYYANSFVCAPARGAEGAGGDASVVAWSTHDGDRFPAAVRVARAVGVQFHPEKSSRAGVAFVRAWVEEAGR